MKVLTNAQMREVDRLTIERGTPGPELMERAGAAVVAFLRREFKPLKKHRVAVFCGKGNNGGDGLVIARLLRERGVRTDVIEAQRPESLTPEIPPEDLHDATIVIDALLGTGFHGQVEEPYAGLIRSINEDFPRAKIVAVDIPSAMLVRADYTVTFAAPKAEMLLGAGSENAGAVSVADIGIPAEFLDSNLGLSEPQDFAPLFVPRKRDAHKGDFGHVLVIGGAPGKTGAAAMAGLAALRAGAGLVTVACADSSRLAPELMTEPRENFSLDRKTVVAVGPGLGLNRELLSHLMQEINVPMVIDADGLNSIAGTGFRGRGVETILTPHPGEMARLIGRKFTDRLATAREFANERNVCVVLKGHRTLIAFPGGQVWINATGTPAMAKGGSGDILTGLIAGFIAQFPGDIETAVRAAVWLHGRAGEIGADDLTEQCLLATDLLKYLPGAIRECQSI